MFDRFDAGRDLQRSSVDLIRVVCDAVHNASVVDPETSNSCTSRL